MTLIVVNNSLVFPVTTPLPLAEDTPRICRRYANNKPLPSHSLSLAAQCVVLRGIVVESSCWSCCIICSPSPPFPFVHSGISGIAAPASVMLCGVPDNARGVMGCTLRILAQDSPRLYPLHFTLSTIKNRPKAIFICISRKNSLPLHRKGQSMLLSSISRTSTRECHSRLQMFGHD